MSFNSLSIIFGGKGVVSPASLLEISSAEGVVDGEYISDDLLLRRLPPLLLLPLLPSNIIFNGGGWVRK